MRDKTPRKRRDFVAARAAGCDRGRCARASQVSVRTRLSAAIESKSSTFPGQ